MPTANRVRGGMRMIAAFPHPFPEPLMFNVRTAILFALLGGAVAPAMADEAELKKLLESRLKIRVDGVKQSPYFGLYEAHSEGKILYTDAKMTYIFSGRVIDGASLRDLTDDRLRELSSIRFSDLPLEQALKTVRGDGRRVIAYFADPNCGHCQRFEKELVSVPDLTVYTFLLPILTPDSTVKSRAVWCAQDRERTWEELMLRGKVPAPADCSNPLASNLDLGKRLNVDGTPTIFLSNGERLPGAVSAAELEKQLLRAEAAKPK